MRRPSGILAWLLVACMAAAAWAQQPWMHDPPFDPATPRPDNGRIGIDVAVTDPKGHAVPGLKQSDLRLLDEGQPMAPVSFAASSADGPAPGDPPVSIVLVLDEADIPRADLGEAQMDLEAFLRRNGGHLSHTVTVYRITADKLYATVPYTEDGNALANVIASGAGMRQVWTMPTIRIMRGPANEIEISSAAGVDSGMPTESYRPVPVPIALKALGAITVEQRRLPGRKLLFWIGPGWRVNLKSDKDLFDTITEFSTRLREARIELSIANNWRLGSYAANSPADSAPALGVTAVSPRTQSQTSMQGKAIHPYLLTNEQVHRYAAGVRLAQKSNYDNLALQVLARRTGGEMLTTTDELTAEGDPGRNNIPLLIAEHIAEASNYYRLTFDPPRTAAIDEYHRLDVKLAHPGLSAHTAAGYYDEPVFYDQPIAAAHQGNIAELEQVLGRKHSDRKLAEELAGMQLTERLSTPRLEKWLKRMPGQRSRRALTSLADASVFLPPPADEVLSLPNPDRATQQAIFTRVVDFIIRQTPRLPNFYAERTTVQFGQAVSLRGETWKSAQPDRTLNYELTSTDHIYFEDGKETTDQQKTKKQGRQRDLLETTGTFGPILVLALKAAVAPGGMIAWSRWEKGPNGPVAVFRYAAAPSMPNYGVGFCCLAVDQLSVPFHRFTTFRGELSVDPKTGHVLRLTVDANIEPRLPLKDSAVMVEYGPVNLGGQTYFCPLRSVSRSRQRQVWQIDEWGMQFKVYGPFKTVLNDVTFSRYHLFRARTTILPGFVPVPQ